MARESRACLERTRRALEPEIQRLIDANKEALRRCEQDHADQVLRVREQTAQTAMAEQAQLQQNLLQVRQLSGRTSLLLLGIISLSMSIVDVCPGERGGAVA